MYEIGQAKIDAPAKAINSIQITGSGSRSRRQSADVDRITY